MKAVNVREALSRFDEYWAPRIVASMNDCDLKVVKLQGDFVWHKHDDTDEVFFVLDGSFEMDYRENGSEYTVAVSKDALIVAQRGVEHRPRAAAPCSVMLFERTGTLNTGDAERSSLTNEAVRA